MLHRYHKISPLLFALYLMAVVSGLTASVRAEPVALFTEEFESPTQAMARWKWDAGTGEVAFAPGVVYLRGGKQDFPALTLRSNPFPKTGAFTVTVAFRYSEIKARGAGITVCGRESSVPLMSLFQEDKEAKLTLLLNNKRVWQTGIDEEWHLLSLAFSETGEVEAFWDTDSVGCSKSAVRPDFLGIGGNESSVTGEWSRLAVQGVQIVAGGQTSGGMALHAIVNPVLPEYRRTAREVVLERWSANRSGKIGTVKGVVSVTDTGRVRGAVFPIETSLVNGSGQVYVSEDRERDAAVSAQSAKLFVQRESVRIGKRLPWEQCDVMVVFPRNAPSLQGESMGVAIATGMLSTITGLPVDSSFAMSGTVDGRGRVQDTGNEVVSVVGALSDPSVRTLVLPDNAKNRAAVNALYKTERYLFNGRRVLLVSDMTQVLRYSLVSENARYDQAAQLVREGVNAYCGGNFAVAIRKFQQASGMMPEDYTIRAWLYHAERERKASGYRPLAKARV